MMGGAQHRGKWKKKICFILFILICLDVCAAAAGVASRSTCKGDEFLSDKGYCCNKCPPGFRLVADCGGPHLRSNCSVCPDGQYQEETNYYRNCFPCLKCNLNNFEKESSICTNKKNTVCECEDGYTKQAIGRNLMECIKLPLESPTKNVLEEDEGYHWSFFVGMALVTVSAVVLAGLAVCKIHKGLQRRGAKQPGLLDSSPGESPSETFIVSSPSKKDSCIQECGPVSSVWPQEKILGQQSQLPDCVPKEIKLSPFIYFVLEHVPADRFKELVRLLGVNERDIERADRDNHSFKESQHQMLKVWGESGGRGVRGTLPPCLVLELLDTLRMIGLTGCAEAIEEKYRI